MRLFLTIFRLITGARVVVPKEGMPTNGGSFDVQLTNGSQVTTDFVILATGQTPNNSLLNELVPSSPDSLINPDNGFIRIKPTMQFQDPQYPNLFAVGDIADTGLRKAARPGSAQAGVVARNIQAMIERRKPEESYPRMPAAIHLTLGMVSINEFRTPQGIGQILTDVLGIQCRLSESKRVRWTNGADNHS